MKIITQQFPGKLDTENHCIICKKKCISPYVSCSLSKGILHQYFYTEKKYIYCSKECLYQIKNTKSFKEIMELIDIKAFKLKIKPLTK